MCYQKMYPNPPKLNLTGDKHVTYSIIHLLSYITPVISVDSCLSGRLAGHLAVVAAALLQFAQAPPSANPGANYIFHTAFAIIKLRAKVRSVRIYLLV